MNTQVIGGILKLDFSDLFHVEREIVDVELKFVVFVPLANRTGFGAAIVE